MTYIYRFISLSLWGNLPSQLQRKVSRIYATIYNQPFTKFIIKPYCKLNGLDHHYLSQFMSAKGHVGYDSFQDFFTRVYRIRPTITSQYIWPCEGLLCDYGIVGELPSINVKGDTRNVKTIFGKSGDDIPNNYYFSNVFLHNNNYHRIHSPVQATVKSIEHIPGDLVLLRPWVYKSDPSLPAMRNERINVVLNDEQNRDWHISIVGGPAVGTIKLADYIDIGAPVNTGDELGKFLLGSTCCMATPEPTHTMTQSNVYVGQKY
jgi:phosphatidylserine decarboxylase